MMIEEKQISQIERYLYNIILITSLLRKANRNLDGIQDTIKIYNRIEALAVCVDMVMFNMGEVQHE
jgi:hypothetical protein